MGVSVIIPAYNEGKRIADTLEDYGKLTDRMKDLRVIVVSESSDDTDRIVVGYSKRHPRISLLHSSGRKGKGAAVMIGFEKALRHAKENDVVGFVDADDSVTSEQFLRLLDSIDGYDCIIGSRYVEGSVMVGRLGSRRHIASRMYNLLVKTLFGMRYEDTQCGAKVFRAAALRGIRRHVSVSGLGFDVNMLYELELDGKRIKEYPIKYIVKNNGTSVTASQVVGMFFSALKYRIAKGGAQRKRKKEERKNM